MPGGKPSALCPLPLLPSWNMQDARTNLPFDFHRSSFANSVIVLQLVLQKFPYSWFGVWVRVIFVLCVPVGTKRVGLCCEVCVIACVAIGPKPEAYVLSYLWPVPDPLGTYPVKVRCCSSHYKRPSAPSHPSIPSFSIHTQSFEPTTRSPLLHSARFSCLTPNVRRFFPLHTKHEYTLILNLITQNNQNAYLNRFRCSCFFGCYYYGCW